MSTQELLHWMLNRCLKQIDPLEKIKRKNIEPTKKSLPLRQHEKVQPLRKNLKVSVRRQVWQQAGGCCQFKDHQSNQCCKSRLGLEIDHIQPLSLGGDDRVENLRLLCREHHKLFTSQSFAHK